MALLPVTKYVSPAVAGILADLGQRDLAESRVQELERKASALSEGHPGAIRWHLVGHLQRNKARRAVRWAEIIHSVDSWTLLESIDRIAAEDGRRIGAFLEVRSADLPGRTGFSPQEVPVIAARARELAHVDLCGLMAMAPPPEGDPAMKAARECFQSLSSLRRSLDGGSFRQGRCLLSMGMSSDFEIAIAEGADIVRIGSLLFAGLEPPVTRSV